MFVILGASVFGVGDMFPRDGITAWEKPFPATVRRQALTKCARGGGCWGKIAIRYVSTIKRQLLG